MKYKKLFIGILLLSIGLAGCENDLTNPVYQSGPSKTTSIGTIELWARHYTAEEAASLPNWDEDGDGQGGWWECDPHNPNLELSKLVPGGELKNETSYEVTITGTSNEPLTNLQFVFTIARDISSVPWEDLSDYPHVSIEDEINVTETLTTFLVPGGKLKENQTVEDVIDSRSDVKSLSKHGILAFTNGVDVPIIKLEDLPTDVNGDPIRPPDEIMATLTNVVITITEK